MDEDIDATNDPHFAYSKRVIAHHLPLKEFDSIIDFGCRDGKTTRHMARNIIQSKATKIVGLDPSVRNIANARMHQNVTTKTPSALLKRKESFSSSPLQVSALSITEVIAAQPTLAENIFSENEWCMTSTHSVEQPSNLCNSALLQKAESLARIQFLVDSLVDFSYSNAQPIEDKRVQLVTSFDTVQRFHNKDNFFKNICELLKDNGTLLLTTHFESPHSRALSALFQEHVKQMPYKNHFEPFHLDKEYCPFNSLTELHLFLRRYSFKRPEIITQQRYAPHSNDLSMYLEHVFQLFIPFVSLPSDQKKLLCDSIAADYALLFSQEDKSIQLPESIIVKATRMGPLKSCTK